MRRVVIAVMFCVSAYYAHAQSVVGSPDGFAKVGNVTGGAGGKVVYVTSAADLHEKMDSNDPYIIVIRGTIDLGGSMHTLRSNKTIIGEGNGARIINGGLESGSKYGNIIIQNIEFVHSPDDLIKIYGGKRFWVDHCTFSDGAAVDESVDGLFDITNAADHITISYCKFFNHSKNILIGAKDGNSADAVTKVTLHHNWFKGTHQRNPRVRFASVHCYNNYYEGNTIYGVVSACDAKVVLENNYFLNVPSPIYIGYDDSPAGKIDTTNNIFVGCGAKIVSNGEAGKKGQPVTGFDHDWSPKSAYDYTPLDPGGVPAYVKAHAGVFNGTAVLKQFEGNEVRRHDCPLRITRSFKAGIGVSGCAGAVLYDIAGRAVRSVRVGGFFESNVREVFVNTSGLGNGTYFLVARTGSAGIRHRLVIAR